MVKFYQTFRPFFCRIRLKNPIEINKESSVEWAAICSKSEKLLQGIFNTAENAKMCGQNMQYANFSKICGKCSKVPNMRQSHIRVFLICLTEYIIFCTSALEWVIVLGWGKNHGMQYCGAR